MCLFPELVKIANERKHKQGAKEEPLHHGAVLRHIGNVQCSTAAWIVWVIVYLDLFTRSITVAERRHHEIGRRTCYTQFHIVAIVCTAVDVVFEVHLGKSAITERQKLIELHLL